MIQDPYPWGDLTSFRTVAEGLTDAIKSRCSTENRVKRGGGAADPMQAKTMVELAHENEDRYREMLQGAFEQHVPEEIRAWAAGIPGLASGELFPRILGILGHPRIAIPYRWEGSLLVPAGEPYERSLRQLWQFAGCGDPRSNPRADILGHSPSREEKLAGGKRTVLRPLLYTFSSFLVRAHTRSDAVAASLFYKILVEAKEAAQGNVHEFQCTNKKRPPMRSNGCGTVLHPELGEPGSPWRPGHVDMHGHRVMHKEFLRELWRISAL
jgi:hypothetical protein